jgi:hypothetical protein
MKSRIALSMFLVALCACGSPSACDDEPEPADGIGTSPSVPTTDTAATVVVATPDAGEPDAGFEENGGVIIMRPGYGADDDPTK